jgi:hypothetical protein
MSTQNLIRLNLVLLLILFVILGYDFHRWQKSWCPSGFHRVVIAGEKMCEADHGP